MSKLSSLLKPYGCLLAACLAFIMADMRLVTAADQPGPLLVLYPEVGEPYNSVFTAIIKGITSSATDTPRRYLLGKNTDNDTVRAWLADEKPRAVIALGQRGLEVARALGADAPWVVGAALLSRSAEPAIVGISLTADPGKLFTQMQALTGEVKHVYTVYTPQQNDWLIELAQRAAAERGLELTAYPAQDVREAAQLYQDILSKSVSRTDAIWLPLDKTLDTDVILSTILKAAWDRKLAVFSSNPAHAKKGALFSLYPDNEALGRTLANMALKRATAFQARATIPSTGADEVKLADSSARANPPPSTRDAARGDTDAGIVPLTDLLGAINLRTADHLDLRISKEQQRRFSLMFPAP